MKTWACVGCPIEKEVNRACQECDKGECIKDLCPIFRIKEVMMIETTPVDINIDDFFEPDDSKKISLFDIEED